MKKNIDKVNKMEERREQDEAQENCYYCSYQGTNRYSVKKYISKYIR